MKRVYFLSFLFLLFIQPVNAYQELPADPKQEIRARISDHALNRIAVLQDRIVSVKGRLGDFELDKDLELGQIYIKPLVKDRSLPIFISTEQGQTYSLSLWPDEREAETLVLAPIPPLIDRPHSYEASIQTLILSLHQDKALEGFHPSFKKIPLPKIKGAKITPLKSYSDNLLLGQVLLVSNTTKAPLSLTETDFYSTQVRAVALLNKTLEPQAKTLVYWVVHHD